MVKFAFSSDCDLMTWNGYLENKAFFKSLNLQLGDSFWLFDPSGGDMALFTYDLEHKGPYHNELLEEIRNGNLDVMHSIGSYGERFNNGFKPNRMLVKKALEYLKENAKVPKIWTNHGDIYNIQGISGTKKINYRLGDDKESDIYLLDLLLEFGIEYFWLDHSLWRQENVPYKILTEEIAQDGNKIKVFKRFMDKSIEWAGNAQNIDKQLSLDTLEKLVNIKQNTIFYTHWGCHHDNVYAFSPLESPLTNSSKEAFKTFVDFTNNNDCKIVRLYDLLKEEEEKNELYEIERIAKAIVYDEKNKTDNFWYNQYNKHSIFDFEKRIKKLNVEGVVLDAGCGVGQWSFAMKNESTEVHGIEINSTAYAYLAQITESLGTKNPVFTHGSIEELPYSNNTFDWIICYGVIFCTNMSNSLSEFYRVMKKGSVAYICLNGDGWYEYLCDDRFRDSSIDIQKTYSQPIYNAFLMRIGGYKSLVQKIDENKLVENINTSSLLREQFLNSFEDIMPKFLKDLLETYSNNIIYLLALHIQEDLENIKLLNKKQPKETYFHKFKSLFQKEKIKYPSLYPVNRAFLPEEFEEFIAKFYFSMKGYGSDGELSYRENKVFKEAFSKPIYDSTFNNHISVWECILCK